MKILTIVSILSIITILSSYAQLNSKGYKVITFTENGISEEKLKPFYFKPDSLIPIDFNQDLKSKSIVDLRILRSSVFARNGQLLMESELRSYFAARYKWYDSITTEIWQRIGDDVANIPVLTDQENRFIKVIDEKLAEKMKTNFIKKEPKLANTDNIINLNEFLKLSPEFTEKLKQNNFVIFPERCPQLFHIYEQNNYSEIPSFVTSDLYLQVMHMYFSYLLRSLEKERFIPIITSISKELSMGASKVAQTTTNPQIKELAEYNQVYFAVPYQLLTGKTLPIPDKYKAAVKSDIKKIIEASTDTSSLVPNFMFSLFKPRGHYNRNDTSRNYFRAMIWLQTVPFCREKNKTLQQAMFMGFLLNKSSKDIKEKYRSLFETISFLIGEPDNLSITDITGIFKELGISDINKITDESIVLKVSTRLAEIVKTKNQIKPKIVLTCPDKINFLPQRYVFDNEILQELVDIKVDAERAFPRSLDVFAVLGNKTSEEILFDIYKDQKKWKDYASNFNLMKTKFQNFDGWNKSVYNKWFQCLKVLQTPIKEMPSFTQTNAWARKTLNTSLASYAELKHDAILYAEQPNAAEMGGGGGWPPEPSVRGYVEPNKAFWKKAIEIVVMSDSLLLTRGLLTEDLDLVSKELISQLVFCLKTTEKELKKEILTGEEYGYIENIGGHVDNLTLSILEPGQRPDYWYLVQSPDTCISVIADVYNRNVPLCPKDGILYEAVGPVHSIYVVVEMGGYLYLTRGAVFSHYEFVVQDENRLTDEDWQQKVVNRKLPEENIWMKDLILDSKFKPLEDDTQQYSPTF